MKKLPIGISTFSEIIEEGYTYIDKTPFVFKMASEGKYYFLSRPRRFGKSLFLDTLAEAFSANKELFKGLDLYDKWDWSIKYPVLKISLGGGVIKGANDLDIMLDFLFNQAAKFFDVTLTYPGVREKFAQLIQLLHEKKGQKVVILIDEYDKPILDNVTRPDIASDIRESLKNIYSVIKDYDRHVKFCFLTGVSKFSKVSLFSGLNNLNDITLNPQYSHICGYTEEELEKNFKNRLAGVDRQKLKEWYNGYNFLGTKVYNPYDLLLFFDTGQYNNYWFETGTPEFLIKLLIAKKMNISDLKNLSAGDELIGSFDLDSIEPETLLFQTGYLTIKSFRQSGTFRSYDLTYPNLEVRSSLTNSILTGLVKSSADKAKNQNLLFNALEDGQIEDIKSIFQAFFSSIPHDWYRKNQLAGYEGYYASIFYCYFVALGLDVIAEDTTNKGQIDLVVKLDKRVYIFEFKVIELTDKGPALKQIINRGYHEKYMAQDYEIYAVGVEFNSKERNISTFEWKRFH